MIDENLVKALINCALFFEYSNEDILNPDAALEVFEQLAFQLQQSPPEVRADIVARFREISVAYGDKAEFVERLPKAMGLL